MQQLKLVGPQTLEWHDVPVPRIESAVDAIVRPLAVSRCDLDLPMILGVTGSPPVPFAFGHEFVAEVVDVGDAVANVTPGMRVLVSFQISCGICAKCRAGLTACCAAVPQCAAYGMAPFCGVDYGGAFSDLVRVPFADAMLMPVPADLPLAAIASGADNLTDGLRTVAPYLARNPGAEVLVIGGGARSVGLYAVAAAVALGSRRVEYVDTDPDRLAAARGAGAIATDMEARADSSPVGSFPITVDASANPAGLSLACRSTEPFGVCTSVGIYFTATTPLPLGELFWKGITFVTARVHSAANLKSAVEVVSSGRIHPLAAAPTRTFAWDETIEALMDPSPKVVVLR